MKILHLPINSAGQGTSISRAQRKLGYKSDLMVFYETKFDYENDQNLHIEKYPRYIRELVMLFSFLKNMFRYDIFHFHCGLTFLPRNFDLPILRFFGKKTVMEYWGSDIMQTDVAKDYTLWTDEELKTIYHKVNNQKQRQKIARFEQLINRTVVGGCFLLPFSPKSFSSRTAVDLTKWDFVGAVPKKDGAVNIIHAPTNRMIKGTDDILKTLDKLKNDGYKFNLILVEGKSNKEAREIYEQADIVIDEIRQGPYGSLAIECMALGKPVICWRSPKFDQYYTDCPVVSADKDTLYDTLVGLLKNPSRREKLGQDGRKYVEKYHSDTIVGQQLIDLYKSLFKKK